MEDVKAMSRGELKKLRGRQYTKVVRDSDHKGSFGSTGTHVVI